MDDNPKPPSTLISSVEAMDELDKLCDEFESMWKEGSRPDISSFLTRTKNAEVSTVLVELIKLDLYYRQQQGEQPALTDYETKFPEHQDALGKLQAQLPTFVVEPRVLGHFKLVRLAGRGGFGDVWDAFDTQLQRRVALKLPRDRNPERSHVRMFLREARAAAQLDHPGVARVYGHGEINGRAYIAYEFVEGLSLAAWIKRHNVTFKEAARICLEIAEALACAHAAGVIHRDLKPANVLVTRETTIKLVDFGLARREDGASTIGPRGTVMGTAAYMSPEQARGTVAVDGRTDIYALGAILYELLTHRPLFKGSNDEIREQVLTIAPATPRSLNRSIPVDLETICLKAISKLSGDRYASGQEMADDLARFLSGEPILGSRLSMLEQSKRWLFQNRIAVATVGVLTLLTGGLLAMGSLLYQQTTVDYQTVLLDTEPSGAEVVFVPLNPLTGEPQPEQKVVAGKSPVRTTLKAGEYLVVAYRDAENFNEVLRKVPSAQEALKLPWSSGRHQNWELADGAIKLWPAKIYSQDQVSDGMALYDPQLTSYIDVTPVTYGDYRKVVGAELRDTTNCETNPRQPDQPISCINLHEAIVYAERCGKRIPELQELQQLLAAQKKLSAGGEATAPNPSLWTLSKPAVQHSELFANSHTVFGVDARVTWRDSSEAAGTVSIHGPYTILPDLGIRTVRSRFPRFVDLGQQKSTAGRR